MINPELKAYNRTLDNTVNLFINQDYHNEGKQAVVDLSFSQPHSNLFYAQKYLNETISGLLSPSLLDHSALMPQAQEKAKKYLSVPGFKIGAYSDSRGTPFIRKNLAKAIEKRDGYKIDINSIFMTNGAMNAYDHIISLIFNKGEKVNYTLLW